MTFCNALQERGLAFTEGLIALYAPDVASFGENLRRLREAAGLSQEELAGKMGQKRPSTVQSWEKSRRRPRPSTVTKLAGQLGCAPGDLVAGVAADYDALKGADAEGTGATVGPALTRIEKRALRLLRLMNDAGQKAAVGSIALLVPSFPRELQPARSAQPAHTPEVKGRKARGKQKVAG